MYRVSIAFLEVKFVIILVSIQRRPEEKVEAEKRNGKMAQKLLTRIHHKEFCGGPIPLDVTIEAAVRRVTELEEIIKSLKQDEQKMKEGETTTILLVLPNTSHHTS